MARRSKHRNEKLFKPASGSRLTNEQALKYGNRLDELVERKGYVSPSTVIDDARHRTSPLHDYFDWDDQVAGEKWRLDQAGYLLRSIVVETFDEDQPQVRQFFSITPTAEMDTSEPKVYVALESVLSDVEKREQVIAYALRELRGWRGRYKQYKEFAALHSAIDCELEKM